MRCGDVFYANSLIKIITFDARHDVVGILPIFVLVGGTERSVGARFGVVSDLLEQPDNAEFITNFA